MPAFRKHKSRLHLALTDADQATAPGGQVLADALCRRFDLWHQLDSLPGLDPRTRTGSGCFPDALIAQLLSNFTSGGVSLADAQRLGQDRVLSPPGPLPRCRRRHPRRMAARPPLGLRATAGGVEAGRGATGTGRGGWSVGWGRARGRGDGGAVAPAG